MRTQRAECAPQSQGGGHGSVHTVIFPVCLKVSIVKIWEISKETKIYQPEIGKKEEWQETPPRSPELSNLACLAWFRTTPGEVCSAPAPVPGEVPSSPISRAPHLSLPSLQQTQ